MTSYDIFFLFISFHKVQMLLLKATKKTKQNKLPLLGVLRRNDLNVFARLLTCCVFFSSNLEKDAFTSAKPGTLFTKKKI